MLSINHSRVRQDSATVEGFSVARLEGKVAIITGGASGIGKATVIRFIEEGAKVVITDRNIDAGQALANQLHDAACFMPHDVRCERDWRNVIPATVAHFGALHILVNNAGYNIPKSIEDTSLDDWREMFDVHAESAFLGCKLALREMIRAGSGSIINISSRVAEFGDPNVLAYSAAKSALQGLTGSITAYCHANDHPVRCNALLPGAIETPLLRGMIDRWAEELKVADTTQYRRSLGQPEDIANTALFLASDESRYINGQMILVDGGRQHQSRTHKERLAHLRDSERLESEHA